jgi:hypothetical protein
MSCALVSGRRGASAIAGLLAIAVPALAAAQTADPKIARLVDAVSEPRLGDILRRLESFGTRHLLSATDAPARGIGAARQWILEEMQRSSPRLQVSFDTYRVPRQGDRITREVELRNVMAVLPGRSPRRVYVSGHYDSVARMPAKPGAPAESAAAAFDWSAGDNPAPGVNDDGSGTALVMELARVFGQSGIEFDATLVFAAFAGEEEGLVGAKLHAQKGEAEKLSVDAVLNNDIVGGAVGGHRVAEGASVRVFSERPEDSPSRAIARAVRDAAALYVPSHTVRLIARHDRFGRGGDHTALNQHGFPGVRFTESKENFARQHIVDDTFEGISVPYLARNTRVNAAALAVLGLAPSAPSVVDDRGRPRLGRQPSGYDAHLEWSAPPGAAGYRVYWRDAWSPDWQHARAVGKVTELVLPDVSIDDFVFGVAALDADGHESVVAAYVNPPRPEVPIKTVP